MDLLDSSLEEEVQRPEGTHSGDATNHAFHGFGLHRHALCHSPLGGWRGAKVRGTNPRGSGRQKGEERVKVREGKLK